MMKSDVLAGLSNHATGMKKGGKGTEEGMKGGGSVGMATNETKDPELANTIVERTSLTTVLLTILICVRIRIRIAHANILTKLRLEPHTLRRLLGSRRRRLGGTSTLWPPLRDLAANSLLCAALERLAQCLRVPGGTTAAATGAPRRLGSSLFYGGLLGRIGILGRPAATATGGLVDLGVQDALGQARGVLRRTAATALAGDAGGGGGDGWVDGGRRGVALLGASTGLGRCHFWGGDLLLWLYFFFFW